MTVTQTPDGRFQVFAGSERLAGPFDTNAEAWRWIDRASGQPVSKAEERGEFSWDRSVDRSFAA